MDHVRMQIERVEAKLRVKEKRRLRAEIARIEGQRSVLDACLKSHWTRSTRNRLVARKDFLKHQENDLIEMLFEI